MKKSLTTTEKGLDIEVTSAGALLRNKNREFLFEIKPESYKRNPGSIMLFGGLFEVGDATPLDILKRELKEELQVDIDEQGLNAVFLGYEPSITNPGTYHARYFVDEVDDSSIVLSEESADILKIKDLADLDTETRKLGIGVQTAVTTFVHEFANK